MASVSELIRREADGTISFGDYTLDAKAKLDNFDVDGALYKVKTYKEITKLEKNGIFVYESVPGTAVFELEQDDATTSFKLSGVDDAQITLGLEEECEYEVFKNGTSSGLIKTNLGGKLIFSVELSETETVDIRIEKK